ncbi:hypothetical protein T484DRAFT_1648775 [Baffinella frigidus]|nr:hypothetical protein T484DRAFT_1648775 [Cryptophyta sp. CCMP2293]
MWVSCSRWRSPSPPPSATPPRAPGARQFRNPNPETPETRNPKPGTRDPRPETRNPRPETRNPEPETRSPEPETRDPRPETQSLSATPSRAPGVRQFPPCLIRNKNPKHEIRNPEPGTRNPKSGTRNQPGELNSKPQTLNLKPQRRATSRSQSCCSHPPLATLSRCSWTLSQPGVYRARQPMSNFALALEPFRTFLGCKIPRFVPGVL